MRFSPSLLISDELVPSPYFAAFMAGNHLRRFGAGTFLSAIGLDATTDHRNHSSISEARSMSAVPPIATEFCVAEKFRDVPNSEVCSPHSITRLRRKVTTTGYSAFM
jgi:hypothetical protein